MSLPKDLINLTRPVNSVMVGFAVIVGISITAPYQLLTHLPLLGFFTGFLISSYSMVVNDLYDLEVDKINRLDRPIAQGRIQPKIAIMFAIILLLFGILSAIVIGLNTFIIASFFAFISWMYNYKGKEIMFIGNFMVAASVAIPYIYGGAIVGMENNSLLWFLSLTSFFAATGREIIKTISDVEGDAIRNVRSIARIYGPQNTAIVGAIFFIGAVSSTILPIIFNQVGIIFIILILIPDTLFLYASIKILKDNSREGALLIKKLALIGMVIGMIVFIIGELF